MAGHSKWANIKHRKAAQDAKRGKIFTRLIREITIAARSGPNPSENSRLRLAIERARGENMGNDTIERAIARGSGDSSGNKLEEILYEGFGPGGVAVLVEAMTDNNKRTVAEVRHQFVRAGGNLGANGSVAWMFQRRGQLAFAPGADAEQLLEVSLEHDPEEVSVNDDDSVEVIIQVEQFAALLATLEEANFPKPDFAEIVYLPDNPIQLGEDDAAKVMRLVQALEELDDVQNVHASAILPEPE